MGNRRRRTVRRPQRRLDQRAPRGLPHDRHPRVQVQELGPLFDIVQRAVFPVITRAYNLRQVWGFPKPAFDFNDLFVVKYEAAHQRALSQHQDGSSFSFTVLLNDPSDFAGGGTYYKAFDRVLHANRGEILVHHGCQEHGGMAITKGVRYLLIGFLGLKGDCEGHDAADNTADVLMERLSDQPTGTPAGARALAREVVDELWHGFPKGTATSSVFY